MLGVAVAAAFQLIVSPPLRVHAERAAAIADLREQRAQFDAIAADRAAAQASLQAWRVAWEVGGPALAGDQPGRAAGSLQSRLETVLTGAGAQVRSVQILPPQAEGALTRLSARVRVTAPDETLGEVLAAVEETVPYLFVDELDVQARRRVAVNPQAGPVAPLQVEMMVSAYLRGGATGEATAR